MEEIREKMKSTRRSQRKKEDAEKSKEKRRKKFEEIRIRGRVYRGRRRGLGKEEYEIKSKREFNRQGCNGCG